MTINIDNLTIGEARQIAAMFHASNAPAQTSATKTNSPLLGEHVLVRTFSAGVHIGTLVQKDGENVLLKDARRVWKWSGAFTLSEVATKGIEKTGSRMACPVSFIELTNANEIIPTTPEARATYDKVKES